MKDIDYTKAVEIYKELQQKLAPLKEEYMKKMVEAYGEEAKSVFDNPAYIVNWLQVYIEAPSEGAVYSCESDSSTFYTLYVNGFEISECVRKKKENKE